MDDMKKKLYNLFDYQLFADNPRLKRLVETAQSENGAALSDDDLSLVAAAGEPELKIPDDEDART